MVSEGYADRYLEGSMRGWYTPCTFGTSAIMAHWVTFLFLCVCTLYLARDSWTARGPGRKERWYAGYHEDYNISLYVNLFAMIAYFGKVVADSVGHNYNNVGPLVIGLGNYRYADYMLTCPLLAYDLMAQVRAPYKVTGAVLIFCVLLTGTATNYYPGDEMKAGSYAWFVFGCFLYIIAYYLFYTIVRIQYRRLLNLAATTDAKKSFMPLKLALYTFFSIWVVFPIVWILGHQGLNILSNDAQECLHCACDLTAKSFYGFALAKYRKYFDKKMYDMLTELGIDAEEGLDHLEQDLKQQELDEPSNPSKEQHGEVSKYDQLRRLSVQHHGGGISHISASKQNPFLPHPSLPHGSHGSFNGSLKHPAFPHLPIAHGSHKDMLRHPSGAPHDEGGWPNLNSNSNSPSPRDRDHDDDRRGHRTPRADDRRTPRDSRDGRDRRRDEHGGRKESVEDLKAQIAALNDQISDSYTRKEALKRRD